MFIKILTPFYFALLGFTVYAHVDTGSTTPQVPTKNTKSPHAAVKFKCYECKENCLEVDSRTVFCPEGQPLCSTVAAAPNFTSTLTCSAGPEELSIPCSMSFVEGYLQEMRCLCSGQLCNMPFPKTFSEHLTNYSLSQRFNHSEESFWKDFNGTFPFYKKLQFKSPHLDANVSLVIDDEENHVKRDELPVAEALKKETPMPSDDDEDDSEGSGMGDEVVTPRAPSAAPAAPSSYRPADSSAASLRLAFAAILLITVVVF